MKQIFYKWLDKRIKNPRKYNYFFYRWVASKAANYIETLDILNKVALWISKRDGYQYLFTDIFVFNNTVYIYTRRPGLWIGKMGQTIDDLQHYINFSANDTKKIHDYEITLIEDKESSIYEVNANISFYLNNY